MHELTEQEIVNKAKEALEYAKIVVDDKDVINKLSQEDFLTIGKTSPEHALLILNRQYLIDKILGRTKEYNSSDFYSQWNPGNGFSFNSNWQALIYLGLSSAEAARVVLHNQSLMRILDVVQPHDRFYGAPPYKEQLMSASSRDKDADVKDVKKEVQPENKKACRCTIL